MPLRKPQIPIPAKIENITPSTIRLSPSSIGMFERCNAQFIIEKFILPKMRTEHLEEISKKGSLFHLYCEKNFDDLIVSNDIKEAGPEIEYKIEEYRHLVEEAEYYKETDFLVENEIVYNIIDKDDTVVQIFGILDKLIFNGKNKVRIIDYKTSMMPDFGKDLFQQKIYAYCLHKLYGYKPENIEINLHYLESPLGLQTRLVTQNDMIFIENKLIAISKKICSCLNRFISDKSIKNISHNVGDNCGLCSVCGNCIAYQIYNNPNFDLDSAINDTEINSSLPIEHVINDYINLDKTNTILKNRLDVLKRHIRNIVYCKMNNTLPEEDVYKANIVEDHFHIIEPKKEGIFKDDYLQYIVPELIKTSIKGSFSSDVDYQSLEIKLSKVIEEYLPSFVSLKSLDAKAAKTLTQTGKIRSTKNSMYIRRK